MLRITGRINVVYVEIAPEHGGTTASLLSRLRHMDRDRVNAITFLRRGCESSLPDDLDIETHAVPLPVFLGRSRMRVGHLSVLNPAVLVGHAYVLLRVAGEVWRCERRLHIDIVHGSALFSNLYAFAIGLLLGRPVIWHINDSRFLENRWLLSLLAGRVKKIVTISRYMERRFIEEGFPRSKIEMIYQPVDTEEFRPLDRERCRNELGVGSDGQFVGFVGRLDPGKGFEDFLQVGCLLRRDRPGITLLVAGSGKNRKYVRRMRELVEGLHLAENTVFLGFREDVPKVLNSMDVLLFPSSLEEAFGRVVAEAGGCCVPVVATDTGAVNEVVVDQETGILVNAGDVRDMAAKVSRLLDDPDLADRMGNAARERVRSMFSPERHCAKLARVYEEVLAK